MDQSSEQEKKFSPAPPETEITIRTMDSDIKAIEQGGGEVGAAQVFSPGGQSSFVKPAEDKQEQVEASLNLPGYSGPEKSIFPSSASVSKPQPEVKTEESSSGGKWKTTAIIIGVFVLIAGLVLLGYFVVFPWLFPAQMPAI